MKKISIKLLFITVVLGVGVFFIYKIYINNQALKKIIERLSADSRVAEVLVTDVKFDPLTEKNYTTIKFMEYDTRNNPLPPKYFTFSENIIQFQALVIRFDDFYVSTEHPLKGKSAYIFTKAFVLKNKEVEILEINRVNTVPSGYEVEEVKNDFEKRLWQRFWRYALDNKESKNVGIKNAQIEAPGTKFIPGMLYTIKIEHDGGLRIDSQKLSPILKGEKIGFDTVNLK